ncbi:MAG TPA: nucleotidyl transferase AbiEii/AbiGii toxin family protein [Smithellaceae bacterium]|nr:nucleotidyl transferase AbiEii/AbiGii toxin family protein [Smithellaceae bacterium]HRY38847.1 nucleotidyl transferase AbiEii/AbiGii toxin family protein [Smithellaceae bacterium]
MRDLIQHEQFELEVLERLQNGRFLAHLIFGGGTMLRFCHALDRYSVDLDFWVIKDIDWPKYYRRMEAYLLQFYKLTDSANKYYTILFELRSPQYPRSLKIEIRKETKVIKTDTSIAYSPNSSVQVMLRTVALADMMKSKIDAFLNRGEIRDAYDIEFLLKRGAPLDANHETLGKLLAGLKKLGKKDFSVKLGALLDADKRKYYQSNGFGILEMSLRDKLGG